MSDKKIKVADGVSVENYNCDPDEQEEHDQVRRNELIRKAAIEAEIEQLKASILGTARELLKKDIPVIITDEMKELGLEETIRAMIFKATMENGLMSKLNNTRDFTVEEFSIPTGDFFGEDFRGI